MGKKKIIVIAVVAVLLIGGGVTALFLSNNIGHNILDGSYADISGAEYMAAYMDNETSASSTSMLMKDYYKERYNCSLYKIDD